MMRKPSSASMGLQSPPIAAPISSQPETRGEAASSVSENPQDLLLRLLNQAKPAQGSSPSSRPQELNNFAGAAEDAMHGIHDSGLNKPESAVSPPPALGKSALPTFGGEQLHEFTSSPQPSAANRGSIFTYVNPFEQLSASSPRNRTPKPTDRSQNATPKVEILKHGDITRQTGLSTPTKQQRASASIFGPGAPPVRETVAEALSEVGEKVDKQVNEALAQMDRQRNGHNAEHSTKEDVKAHHEGEGAGKDEFNTSTPNQPEPIPSSTKEDSFDAGIAESWEHVDPDDRSGKATDSFIKVFNFPMKPFVSIEIKKLQEPSIAVSKESVMDIVRLKKEFDQIDRNLVTATKNFIVYALSKNGGFRLIRQDTGQYKQLFQSYQERIFNLGVCTSQGSVNPDIESVLGTGVNGTVFWTLAATSGIDTFADDNLEERGLVFPPSPSQDEYTSGTPLKTRAKPSSRHPEFFGIGRGKYVYIIFPKVARDMYIEGKDRTVNSTEYLKNRNLRIATGKAGKDFAFSADDTVIVTLDKVGKMKFWDIRGLTKPEFDICDGVDVQEQIETPLLTLSTTLQGEKTQPTSVILLDKERPAAKGIALRYLIVGTKQNHTIQLWDLGLSKPVQEINLPHESDSDAICSLAYHPKTGILAIGHPTRNSIYFIHVSAPRYNIPAMTQAKYISRLATADPTLPKPDSTAIMSGIREVSFASKGELRSLDMLTEPGALAEQGVEPPLFELYVMHSKGVLCLGIKPEDLGLDKDNKVIHSVEASECIKSQNIICTDLRLPEPYVPSEPSSIAGTEAAASRTQSTPSKATKKDSSSGSRAPPSQSSEAAIRASTLARVEDKQDAARAAIVNGGDKPEKKKKKRTSASENVAPAPSTPGQPATETAPPPAPTFAQIARREPSPLPTSKSVPVEETAASSKEDAPGSVKRSEAPAWANEFLKGMHPGSSAVSENDLKKVTEALSSDLSAKFAVELEKLYQKFDSDKRVQEAAGGAKQDAILRLVSKTLTENVEKSLTRIVVNNMQAHIVPQLTESLKASLDRSVTDAVTASLGSTLTKELQPILSTSLGKTLQEPKIVGAFSDLVASKVSQQVNLQLTDALNKGFKPAITAAMVDNSKQIIAKFQQQFNEQQRLFEAQRQADAAKIEQLMNLVHGLSETVHVMAAAQTDFQSEILKQQKAQHAHPRADATQHTRENSLRSPASTMRSAASPIVRDPEQEELAALNRMMNQGEFENATITWLQSPRQTSLFDKFFVRFSPAYVQHLSPLVALSVSAAVSSSCETFLHERLTWLEVVLSTINTHVRFEVCALIKIPQLTFSRILRLSMLLPRS